MKYFLIVLAVMVGVWSCSWVISKENKIHYDDQNCIRAIVGEASGEGYWGMYCVAHALKNRGTLTGVYGVNAKHVDFESAEVWADATQIWYNVTDDEFTNPDPTKGATEWRNSQDLEQHGYPVGNWIQTYNYRNHFFFKKQPNQGGSK